MKPILNIINVNLENDKISLTKEELQEIIDNAYNAGVKDGCLYSPLPYSAPPLAPYPPYTGTPPSKDWNITWSAGEVPCATNN